MSSWDQFGDAANFAQLTGLDAVRLITLIGRAAAMARMHKRNCRQFAQHLRLVGNLLEQLRVAELRRYPETREPLEQLEDALRRAYLLVHSCQDRSYLYLLAMGWNIVNQFRKAQNEIDRYLRLVPLISLVDNARVREKLEYIERDQCEYTLDEEDKKVQDALLNPDPCETPVSVLKKTLSCSYPNLPFNEALKKENEKLQMELQRSQSNMDIGQCDVIQHLLGVTETVASSLPEKCHSKKSEKLEGDLMDTSQAKADSLNHEVRSKQNKTYGVSSSPVLTGHSTISKRQSHGREEWHSDLLSCCSEPYLCIQTFFFPCGTFSRIASIAKNRPISPAEACNDLLAYSLILSCCCYTCCVRRKLRNRFNIEGGFCDDFLSHLMCCCCALVQEWREVEIRGVKSETVAPPIQRMES